jgi:hypothetical protein
MKKLFLLLTLLFAPSLFAQFQSDIILTSPDGVWTDSRAYSTLNSAVTAVGANVRTIVIASPQTVTNLTIPSTVTLQFERNGSISNSGQLTINTRNIEAPNRQIFTGAGNIDFADGSIIKTGWFSNLESALALTTNDKITLEVSKPQTVSASYAVGNDVILRWLSPENILTVSPSVTISNIHSVEAGNYQIFAGTGTFTFVDGIDLKLVWFNSFRSAVTWIGSTIASLKVTPDYIVDLSDSTSVNTVLDFISLNGSLSANAGVTVTINSTIKAGPSYIFKGLGTYSITALSKTTEVYPQMWGAKGDCDPVAVTGTDDSAAINKTTAAANASSIRRIVFPRACYSIGTSTLIAYSYQEWDGQGSTLRRIGRLAGNTSVRMIESSGWVAGTIEDFYFHDFTLWGDGEESGKSASSNVCSNFDLYKASGVLIENVDAKYSGGDCFSIYGLPDGKANVIQNLRAGPGWGQVAISSAGGNFIWDNIEVTGAPYAGANPGLYMDMEVNNTTERARHWMNNIRTPGLIFPDLYTLTGGEFLQDIYIDNSVIGPTYKAFTISSLNPTIASNIHIGPNVSISGLGAGGFGFWLDNVSGVKVNGSTIYSTTTAGDKYAVGIDGTVNNLTMAGVKYPNAGVAGNYSIVVNGSNLVNSRISNSYLGDMVLGGASTGNYFSGVKLDTLTLRGPLALNNTFDESSYIHTVTQDYSGKIGAQTYKNRKASVVNTYDFSISGGAVGDIQLLGDWLPINSIVTRVSYEVISALTSAGAAQVTLGHVDHPEGITTWAAYNNAKYTVGFHDGIPTGLAATFMNKLVTGRRPIYLTIGGAPLTAGKIVIWADYVWTE